MMMQWQPQVDSGYGMGIRNLVNCPEFANKLCGLDVFRF